MMRYCWLGLFLLPACEPRGTGPDNTASVVAETPIPPVPVPFAKPDRALLGFLAQHDVAALLRPTSGSPDVYNGFWGGQRKRVEWVFLRVEQHKEQPNVLVVLGKRRVAGRITSFAGSIVLTAVRPQPPLTEAEKTARADEESYWIVSERIPTGEEAPGSYCTLLGAFSLHEQPGPASSQMQGTVRLDVHLNMLGKARLSSLRPTAGARGAGALFAGTHTDYRVGGQQEFTVAEHFSEYVRGVAKDFFFMRPGDRQHYINPKYVKLGWNSYWENDEWWAEPTKATARKPPVTSAAEAAPDNSAGL